MKQQKFSRDFFLVVIGQIISLFGNAAIRFALPLYLLNQTGSSALYGTVTACAFIPAIGLSPIGGIIADRVNKRNIMVILDFSTAAVITLFFLLTNSINLILLLTVTLMLLYGIYGAYQPAVQASVPALVQPEYILQANSIINMISSLAALLGPVLGGILYSAYGLTPVLFLCIVCFILSAVMELFIKIPFVRQPAGNSIPQIIKDDFSVSLHFIWKDKSVIGKGLLAVCGINLFLSSMIIVGLPYMVTEVLDFTPAAANKLYGFAEGALAAGGLAGGLCAGIFARKLTIEKSGTFIVICAICVFPMGIAPALLSSPIANYAVLTVCCFLIMIFSTLFSVQVMAFVQTETPQRLIGKVISVILTVTLCAQPLGNALYGLLFQVCDGFEYAVILLAGIASLLISFKSKGIFRGFVSHAGEHDVQNRTKEDKIHKNSLKIEK